MRSIYEALKPGGVMVCEECGARALYTESPSQAYQEMLELGLNAGKRRGVDYDGGRRMHVFAREAGFEIVHAGHTNRTILAASINHFGIGPW